MGQAGGDLVSQVWMRVSDYMERQVGLHQSWRGLGCLGVWAGGGFWTLNMV